MLNVFLNFSCYILLYSNVKTKNSCFITQFDIFRTVYLLYVCLYINTEISGKVWKKYSNYEFKTRLSTFRTFISDSHGYINKSKEYQRIYGEAFLLIDNVIYSLTYVAKVKSKFNFGFVQCFRIK